MLRWRLLLGTLLIAAVAGLCWADHRAATPGVWLLPLALLLAWAASGEVRRIAAARGIHPIGWVMDAASVAIVAANAVPLVWTDTRLGQFGWPLATWAIAVLVAFAGEIVRYRKPGEVLERLAVALLGLSYVGGLMTFIVQLRLLDLVFKQPRGIAALASLAIVVKLCDTGAYTVGRLIGRHKLAPILSPGKTIEGAIGGLAFAVLGAWLAIGWLAPLIGGKATTVEPWRWIAYGLIVGVAGTIGDLAESLLKRDAGVKDSSDWLPGFGGVLDILDSLLFAAPVAYLCWILGLVSK